MTKPSDIEQWAWGEAGELMQGFRVTSEWFHENITIEQSHRIMQGKIALALMAVAASVSIKEIVRLIPKGGE